MKRKNKIYCGTYGLFLGFKVSLSIWLRWAKEKFKEGRMVYFRNNSYRHRRSIAVQSLKRLYGVTVSDLLLPIEFPKRFDYPHGIGYKQFKGQR